MRLRLTPREDSFYDMFADSANNLVTGARLLVELISDGADRAVVRAIVELCDSLGLTTVAEGVEQASQAYALESLGVAEVQGFFYGRPMNETAATEWLIPRVPHTPRDAASGF